MAKKKDGLSLEIKDGDLKGLLRTFSKMDDIAKNDMKKIAADISKRNAELLLQRASSAPNSKQATAVASSIEVISTSKDPALKIIRKNVVTSSGARSGELFPGSEFGSTKFKQFPARSPKFGRGNEGYWLYKTLRERQPQILKEWLEGYKLIRDAWMRRV
jgi:hypothetical protein